MTTSTYNDMQDKGGRTKVRPPRIFGILREPVGLVSLLMIVVLALLVVPPILILIQLSFADIADNGAIKGYTFAHYSALFSGAKFFGLLWTTIVFAAFATVISLLFGGILAWLVERLWRQRKEVGA